MISLLLLIKASDKLRADQGMQSHCFYHKKVKYFKRRPHSLILMVLAFAKSTIMMPAVAMLLQVCSGWLIGFTSPC